MLALAERVITVRWSRNPARVVNSATRLGIMTHISTLTGITRIGRFKSLLLAASMISGEGPAPFFSRFRQSEMGLSIRLIPITTAKKESPDISKNRGK